MTGGVVDEGDPIVQRLRSLVQASPGLKDLAQLYKVILPLLRDADLPLSPAPLSPEESREKIASGVPLLENIDLALDFGAAENLMLRLVTALEDAATSNREHYRRIRIALKEDQLDLSHLLPLVTAGERDLFTAAAEPLHIDSDLLWTLAQNTLKPVLRSWCRQLTPLAEGIPWHKGYCFVCGADALLGELQGNHLGKHLRCGQCGADWPVSRLHCFSCGNEDHQTLSYLYAEPEQEKMRVEVCDRCKGYLKVIISFAPAPPSTLALEDLATLHLDYIAKERGYRQRSKNSPD